jgi:Zn-dependent M16 (insulinase) family peptidase
MDPSTKGYVSMVRKFSGLNDEEREKFRGSVLQCDRRTVLESGLRVLAEAGGETGVSAYASEEKLARENEELQPPLVVKKLTCL